MIKNKKLHIVDPCATMASPVPTHLLAKFQLWQTLSDGTELMVATSWCLADLMKIMQQVEN